MAEESPREESLASQPSPIHHSSPHHKFASKHIGQIDQGTSH